MIDLEDIAYENIPQEYKDDVKKGLWTESEALREYRNEVYQGMLNDIAERQELQAMQMPA